MLSFQIRYTEYVINCVAVHPSQIIHVDIFFLLKSDSTHMENLYVRARHNLATDQQQPVCIT